MFCGTPFLLTPAAHRSGFFVHAGSGLTGALPRARQVWDVRAGKCQQTIERAHGTRVKGLAPLAAAVAGGVPGHFTSAASDGVVKVRCSGLRRRVLRMLSDWLYACGCFPGACAAPFSALAVTVVLLLQYRAAD